MPLQQWSLAEQRRPVQADTLQDVAGVFVEAARDQDVGLQPGRRLQHLGDAVLASRGPA